MSKVVVVESPAKAKTINKYLGGGYTVLASFGHIRDLPPKDGSVRPDDDFSMDWELSERSSKPVNEIVKASKGADAIYLASDPDREGEAIAWHVQEVLRARKDLKSVPMYRVTFNEITKNAVRDAMANPREIDGSLVDAYMARRALDYLVGFSLSPVLWRKLKGAKSAGRVQSVALRLICERESEIEKFRAQEFWSIEGIFRSASGETIVARLTHLNGQKLDKFALKTEAEARAAVAALEKLDWSIAAVERKQVKRHPYPPFTTSTLQQAASRRLGMGATRTMRTAQSLYEGVDIGGETVGLITYMRTDGVTLSGEAIAGARAMIGKEYGAQYLPEQARQYKTAAKNAQEAHEAIRPTDMGRRPEHVAKYLDDAGLKLYTLIWQRAIASQMATALLDQVAVDIASDPQRAVFRASGSVVAFDGWLRVYQEDQAEDKSSDGDDASSSRLPQVKEGDKLKKQETKPEQHFTQPPPRYSEASLVKRLEELGIGRPSTYASIMQVLQDREYVRLDKRRFVPEDRGRLVTAFLENFFRHYVEYDFTADLEEKLDEVSGGRLDWKKVMRDFWKDFSAAVGDAGGLKVSDVIDRLDEAMGPHFFPPREDGSDPRKCLMCADGRMGIKIGKFGAFIGCSNYPECRNTMPLAMGSGGDGEGGGDQQRIPPRPLGDDPATGLPVTVRVGPYGAYAQLGPALEPPAADAKKEPSEEPEAEEGTKGKKKAAKPKKKKKEAAEKPKRVSLPKGMDANAIDLDVALRLLALPREVGAHPESGEMITAGIGRFGSYLKMGSRYKNLTDGDDVLSVGLNRAVTLLAEPNKGRAGGGAPAGRLLGEHPQDGGAITVQSGRFGPYVKWGKVNATITKDISPDEITVAQAVELLAARVAKMAEGGGGKKFTRRKKA